MNNFNVAMIVTIINFIGSYSFGATLHVDSSKTAPNESFHSIQQAIKAAKPGDDIIVHKGTYPEALKIHKRVTVKGENPEEVFIVGAVAADSQILCSIQNTECSISNITFHPNDSQRSGGHSALLSIHNSTSTVDNCVFKDASDSAIWALGEKTNVTVKKCHFEKSKNSAVNFYDNAKGNIINCIFNENLSNGLAVQGDAAHIVVEQSTFTRNGEHGIIIFQKASADINNCRFDLNKFGIGINDANSVNLSDNTCIGNMQQGIYLTDTPTVQLHGNTCNENGNHGISISGGVSITITGNSYAKNKGTGFSISGKATKISMSNNTATGNGQQGIFVGEGTLGTIAESTCSKNTKNGIMCSNSDVAIRDNTCEENNYSGICISLGSMAQIQKNHCNKNGHYGIKVEDIYSVPTLSDNICHENKITDQFSENGSYGRVRNMLFKGQYAELENIIANIRNNERRDKDGGWDALGFYENLSIYTAARKKENIEKYEQRLQAWIEEKPESITPQIVLAKHLICRAWHERGTELANAVTDEEWRGLYHFLNQALSVLEKTGKLKPADPEIYHCYLNIGLGLGKPRVWMDDKLQKGIAIQPEYHYLYAKMAEYLLPKWHGNKELLHQFADNSFQQTENGKIIYARIVSGILYCQGPSYLMELEFPYDKVKESFECLLSRYTESYRNLNRLCLLACMNNDRETAKRLFPKIENNVIASVWLNDSEYFKEAKAWAFLKENRNFSITP